MRSTEYIKGKKVKLDYLKPYIKIYAIYTMYLNVKSETLKFSEVNVENNCYDFRVSQHFVKQTTKCP